MTYQHQLSDFPLVKTGEILRLLAKLYGEIRRNKVQFCRRHRERDVFQVLLEMQTVTFAKKWQKWLKTLTLWRLWTAKKP